MDVTASVPSTVIANTVWRAPPTADGVKRLDPGEAKTRLRQYGPQLFMFFAFRPQRRRQVPDRPVQIGDTQLGSRVTRAAL